MFPPWIWLHLHCEAVGLAKSEIHSCNQLFKLRQYVYYIIIDSTFNRNPYCPAAYFWHLRRQASSGTS